MENKFKFDCCGMSRNAIRMLRIRYFVAAIFLVASFLVASMGGLAEEDNDSMLVVTTQQGRVAGESVGEMRLFRGIPFAAPPVGDLRWQPPKAAQAWSGVRDAKAFAPACVQEPHPVMNIPSQPVSEDCLYLNVWTPAKSPEDKLAVLVWIHGGGFAYGSTAMPLFDGKALAKKGVVFVSTAYRLGPFGFLAHPELSKESEHGVSGNYALLDQIAALQWVKNNIQAFGGDPGRVTIMGESAGGMAVSALAQSPLASDLFHGVISQSGGSLVLAGSNVRNLKDAEQSGVEFAQAAGIKTAGIKADGASTLAELRALPAEKVLQTAKASSPFTRRDSWPVLDGYVLPDDPIKIYRQSRQNDTPILIGNNDREGDLFPHAQSVKEFKAHVQRDFGSLAGALLEVYPAGNDAEAERSAAALAGDTTFGIQSWTWARLQSRFGKKPVFYFHFDHNPPPREGVPPGPIHGAELPYVFGTQDIRPIAWTKADRELSEMLMSYWTNFVKTGDPNGAGLSQWPVFSASAPTVLYFRDGKSESGPVPHEAQLRVLDPLETAGE